MHALWDFYFSQLVQVSFSCGLDNYCFLTSEIQKKERGSLEGFLRFKFPHEFTVRGPIRTV